MKKQKIRKMMLRSLSVATAVTLTAGTWSGIAANAEESALDDFEIFGVVGTFTGWGSDDDITMNRVENGLFKTTIKDIEPGVHSFKVRADSSWDYSWGVYEADYDRTLNSRINVQVNIPSDGCTLIVYFDTGKPVDDAYNNPDSVVNDPDYNFSEDGVRLWGVTYEVISDVNQELTNNSYVESDTITVGNTVDFHTEASGGSGGYKFAIYSKKSTDSKWTTIQDYTNIDSISFPLYDVGEYSVCVKVKDSSGNISKKYFDITVIDSFEYQHTYGLIGSFNDWMRDVNMTDEQNKHIYTAVVNDLEPGEYEFRVRADGEWDYSWAEYEEDFDRTQNSQTNCRITVPEGSTGRLTVTLDTGRVSEEALNNPDSMVNEDGFDFARNGIEFWPVIYSLDVEYDELTNLSSTEKDMILSGGEIGIHCKAAGGEGSYKYTALAKKTDTDKWSTIQSFSDNDEIVFKPSEIGEYEICVKVRDSKGDIAKKYFTVKVIERVDKQYRFSVISSFSDWEEDIAMTDDGTGLYKAEITDLASGNYEFVVRADGEWDNYWGEYEEDYDCTRSSDINCYAKVNKGDVLVVYIDTTKVSDAARDNEYSYVNSPDFDFFEKWN